MQAKQCLDAGAAMVVVNGEDLMEEASWDAASIAHLAQVLGLDRLLFEAPHPEVVSASG